jgi:nucleoside-diphosphate-sugar epimerase
VSCEGNKPELTMTFANRRVMVTGGCGFVGSHLVRRLVQMNSRVTSLGGNRDETEQIDGAQYIFGNISRNTLETVDFVPDTIFHLAGGASVAASVADPPGDFLATVFSSVLLLDFLRSYWPQTQLVYVSSAAIYGEAEHKTASHDLTCLPISPYGLCSFHTSKWLNLRQLQVWLCNHNAYTTIRYNQSATRKLDRLDCGHFRGVAPSSRL